MANTTALQEVFEWVRSEMSQRHGRTFERRSVPLRSGGTKVFNAVAGDRSVVATIINASGTTSGGKKPIGKIRGAVADLHFLTLAQAQTRQLVITNPEFYSLFVQDLEGAIDPGVSVVHVSLPPELAARVAAVTHAASQEMNFE
jgi:hypothetical protein